MSAEQPWPAWATEPVAVVDAEWGWAATGQRERRHLETVLAHWLTAPVEHVGSTAVPGLPAKPIIDLQAAVADLGDVDAIAQALVPHAWHYVGPHLDQRPWRRFFVKVVDGRRYAHLHVTTTEAAHWHHRIAFRDALRTDAAAAAEYGALKRVLAIEHMGDREAYTAAKTAFVEDVLGRST